MSLSSKEKTPGFSDNQEMAGEVPSDPSNRSRSYRGATGTPSSCVSGGHTNDCTVQKGQKPKHPLPKNKTDTEQLVALKRPGYKNFADVDVPHWEAALEVEDAGEYISRSLLETTDMWNFFNNKRRELSPNTSLAISSSMEAEIVSLTEQNESLQIWLKKLQNKYEIEKNKRLKTESKIREMEKENLKKSPKTKDFNLELKNLIAQVEKLSKASEQEKTARIAAEKKAADATASMVEKLQKELSNEKNRSITAEEARGAASNKPHPQNTINDVVPSGAACTTTLKT